MWSVDGWSVKVVSRSITSICNNWTTGCLAVAIYRSRFLKALTLTVLVTTIDAQWEGMGDVGSARYEPALLPPCPTIRVLSYSNQYIFRNSAL